MARSLILGGTRGLGLALADESISRFIATIAIGRSADPVPGSIREVIKADLADPGALARVMRPEWQNVRYVFWVAGIFLRKQLCDCGPEEIDTMVRTHLTGPIGALTAFHRLMKNAAPLADPPGLPYHLVVVASTSSWKVRQEEALYCALKAAKAHLTRNFAREIIADLPGSKVTLVNPGGIRTPGFWRNTGQDISRYMEPADLAKVIWDHVLSQTGPFDEIQVLRDLTDGTPFVERGPHKPESPF